MFDLLAPGGTECTLLSGDTRHADRPVCVPASEKHPVAAAIASREAGSGEQASSKGGVSVATEETESCTRVVLQLSTHL